MIPSVKRDLRLHPGKARAVLLVVLLAVAASTASCREGPELTPRESPEPPPRPAAVARPSNDVAAAGLASSERRLADAAPASSARTAPSALVELRERRLVLGSRPSAPGRLAFTRRHLAVLSDTELVLIDTVSWTVARRVAVAGPRRVASTVDGGFVVAAEDATLRLEPRALAIERYPRLTLFAASELWADRRVPTSLWIHHAGDAALYSYRLEATDTPRALLAPAERVELPEHDGGAVLALKDGAFAYTAGDRLLHLYPSGKSRPGAMPDGAARPWRLLPSRRIDELWVASTDGAVALWRLAPRVVTVARLALGGAPFEIAASDRHLAVVRTVETAGAPRAWSLVVYDSSGKERFTAALPPDPPPDTDDWVARATRDREVVLARADPWVAVGGPTSLLVFHADSGVRLFSGAP